MPSFLPYSGAISYTHLNSTICGLAISEWMNRWISKREEGKRRSERMQAVSLSCWQFASEWVCWEGMNLLVWLSLVSLSFVTSGVFKNNFDYIILTLWFNFGACPSHKLWLHCNLLNNLRGLKAYFPMLLLSKSDVFLCMLVRT